MEARQEKSKKALPLVVPGALDGSGYIPTIIDAGVDWITLTCNEVSRFHRLEEVAVALLHVEHEFGHDVKPWNWLGFEGLHGGGVGFGKMDQMVLMRLSSTVAWEHWQRCFELATNCSRIDLQVTVKCGVSPAAQILKHHEEAEAHVAGWLRKPTIDLRLSNASPPTVYFNKRISDRFGRIYDKGFESKLAHYVDCLRYEVQFNGKAGLQMASVLSREKPGTRSIVNRVAGYFSARGLSLGWSSSEPSLLCRPRKRTDAQRRLSWIRTQVRPCVEDLISRGLRNEVLEALGISGDDLDQVVD